MKLIDWYILKRFLTAFVFVVLIMVTIVSVINLTEMNDKFIKHNLSAMEIAKYYLYFSPYIANFITPIMVFISTVFITSKMASHTEIIAILSSGVSFRRLMLPYIIGATIIGGATFFLKGWIIPNSNKYRIAFDLQYLKNPYYFDERNVHFKIDTNTYAYLESYNTTDNVGYRFTLEKMKGNTIVEKLTAETITWQPEKNKWKISQYKTHTFDGLKETISKAQSVDSTLNLYPKDFGSTYLLHETFTLNELDNYIKEQKARGKEKLEIYYIEKYLTFAYPFSIVILTLIGLIVSARKSRGGVGFQIALGFLLAFIYIIFFVMSKSIAQAGAISPVLAVWLPNIVFSMVGIVMYFTVPR